MAIDFAAMLAHERRKKKELAEKEAKLENLKTLQVSAGNGEPKQLHRLTGEVGDLAYVSDFLTTEDAAALERAILTEHSSPEWLVLPQRQLLNLGGVPHPDGMIAETLPSWLEPLMCKLHQTGAFPQGIVPDQVLLNRYGAGDGIDPHADGALFEPYVAIVSLQSAVMLQFLKPPTNESEQGYPLPNKGVAPGRLAATWEDLKPAVATVLLQPRSLFVFSGEAYSSFLHGIATPEAPEPHALKHIDSRCVNLAEAVPPILIGDEVQPLPRLSLTIRAVRKVAIPAGEFLTQAQREEARRRRDWWARAVSERGR